MAMIDHLSTLQMHYSSCFKGKNIHTLQFANCRIFWQRPIHKYDSQHTQCSKIRKKSHSTLRAMRGATFTLVVDKSSLKCQKMSILRVFEACGLNSVTRLVKFNGTKIGKKCQNCKFKWDIFGHFQSMYKSVNCLLLSLSLPNKRYTIRFQK